MRITFFGAVGEVTGSCYHVALQNGEEFLVDGGYFQGHEKDLVRNATKLPVDWQKVKSIFLTHAHLDHCGRIPIFYKQGFRGKIYATAPSAEIAEVIWRDNLHLLETARNLANTDPFYTKEDIEGCIKLFEFAEYNKPIGFGRGVTAEFFDAGHIIGSSSIKFDDSGNAVVFSGDLGNDILGIVDDPEHPRTVDTVVMESTYGNRKHDDTGDQQTILKSYINKIVENKSTLLIPAFAIERTQELLIDINDLVESGKIPPMQIFLDSPMATKVTEITRKHQKFLSEEIRRKIAGGDDPFAFKGLTITENSEDSKKINFAPGPKIIIASSGMMTGGRVVFHLMRVLPDPRSIVLIVGYQVVGTTGRDIQDKKDSVYVDGHNIQVRCSVESTDVYSAHADQSQLLEWLSGYNPQPRNIVLAHGDQEAVTEFKSLITAKFRSTVYTPSLGEIVSL